MLVSPHNPVDPLIHNVTSAVSVPVSQHRLLNDCGRNYLDRWVVANATDPAKQSLPAWHRYAEIMANQSDDASDWVIEMAMSQTKSGYPEELRCPPQWFDAQ